MAKSNSDLKLGLQLCRFSDLCELNALHNISLEILNGNVEKFSLVVVYRTDGIRDFNDSVGLFDCQQRCYINPNHQG